MAILSGSTVDVVRSTLIVEGARAGFAVDPVFGPFGQLEQPVLDASGPLYAPVPPDVLVSFFQPTDLKPDVFDRYHASKPSRLDGVCEELIERLVGAAKEFRQRTGRPVLLANFATPSTLPLGPFDAGDPDGATHRLARYNLVLAERAKNEAGVYVWDYAGLVREMGSAHWTDRRLQMLARVAVGSAAQPALARHLIRTLSGVLRPPSKCLVLDLDNTLWGGVIGDDGLEGIRLGDDWPGNAFKAFQQAVLGLRDRGILLAVASKNDQTVAEQAIRRHPEMLIRWEDLAAVRINWQPKSDNLRAIAHELNIGVDALVLFDDNPVERAEVRSNLPEAGVIDVPSDPLEYVGVLAGCGLFDQVGLSDEDRERADMYGAERARTALLEQAPSIEEFLRGLGIEVEVGGADTQTMGRIAQLVGKTNQFNLTTRRHSSADLARMTSDRDVFIGWLRVRDRLGDQGLVSVGILQKRAEIAHIDTFLMSCRVMNRGVEQAMMSFLAETAVTMGCRRLVGEYRPTPKNGMVKQFYPQLGFTPIRGSEESELWEIDVNAGVGLWPSHIERAEPSTDGRLPGAARE